MYLRLLNNYQEQDIKHQDQPTLGDRLMGLNKSIEGKSTERPLTLGEQLMQMSQPKEELPTQASFSTSSGLSIDSPTKSSMSDKILSDLKQGVTSLKQSVRELKERIMQLSLGKIHQSKLTEAEVARFDLSNHQLFLIGMHNARLNYAEKSCDRVADWLVRNDFSQDID